MERHIRGRRAHRRLGVVAAACAALAACVPLAPFERPAEVAASEGEAVAAGPSTPPDLPEPGDSPVAAVEPAPAPDPAAAPAASSGDGAVEPAPSQTPQVAEPQPAASPDGEAPAGPAQQDPAAVADPAPDEPPVATVGSESAPPAAVPAAEAQVRTALEAFYDAYNARDWKRARGHFWDGATISGVRPQADKPAPVVKVNSVAEFFDEFSRAPESGSQGFEGRLEGEPEVRAASNVAQAWCHFEARFGGPEESMSWRRVDAFTFVLHEGTWKIASLAQSTSFDAPETR
jgi:hypothetical protein